VSTISAGPEPIFIERYFGDGRRAEVVTVEGRVLARVYASSGRLYLEHEYESIGEATTTVMLWNGDGWPLSEQQRRNEAPR
jgi:hypothetical protein